MSEKALKWFADLPPELLTHAEYRLLNRLVWLHNEYENCCWPSYEYLIKKTGLSKSGIANCLTNLERKNLITREKTDGKNTRYFMCFDPPATSPLSGIEENQLVHSVDQTSLLSGPELVHSVDHNIVYNNNNLNNTKTPHTPQAQIQCKNDIDELFEKIWEHYPRRVGKKPARKAFDKAVKQADLEREILPALRDFCKSNQNAQDISKIPHLSTWLNQERWADDQQHACNEPMLALQSPRSPPTRSPPTGQSILPSLIPNGEHHEPNHASHARAQSRTISRPHQGLFAGFSRAVHQDERGT